MKEKPKSLTLYGYDFKSKARVLHRNSSKAFGRENYNLDGALSATVLSKY